MLLLQASVGSQLEDSEGRELHLHKKQIGARITNRRRPAYKKQQ